MKGKKKQSYNKLRDPDYKLAPEQFSELNKEFYEGFLNDYYGLKVINLLSVITNTEKHVENLMKQQIEIDKLKIELEKGEIETENMTKFAKVELAMTYFHCLETFIRLFIAHAKLSGCPWLEIAKLSISKYKEELKKISEGKFNHLNNRIGEDETILYVFTGLTKPDGEITEEFIEGYKEWLTFSARELLETYDYNSFKHGLAVSPSQNGFTLGRPNEDFKIEAHGEVIEHLTRMESGERLIWAKQTNFVSYDKKATFILMLERFMTSILDVGKEAFLEKGEGIRVTIPNKLSPQEILKSDSDNFIKVNSFRKGLLYYK
ncbi:hypothetical protein [Mesobacillus jeotgali]|uniref:hypothetical protein n=1 Tax=Mesobacillus jeotgali TaxID=129985 RepID=UPI000C81D1DB|nr:hypothetical protein [Mesobacillus jeotgali]